MNKRRRRRPPEFDWDFPALTVAQARDFLRHEPDVYHAWMYLGVACRKLRRYDEARQALRRAIKSARLTPPPPNHTVASALRMAFSEMGALYEQSGSYPAAAAWYRRTIEVDPGDASGYLELGTLLAQMGRLAEAERVHRRATRCRRGCVDEAHLNRGLVLRSLERFRDAEKCFQKALELNPKCRLAKTSLRDLAERAKFNARTKTVPSFKKCVTALSQDRAATVVAMTRRRLESFPRHAPTWTLLGVACGLSNRLSDAKAALAKGLKVPPTLPRHHVWFHQGEIFRHAGNFRSAAKRLNQAIEAAPKEGLYHLALGELLADQGRPREAANAFRRALRCPDVDAAEAHLNLGFVHRARNRFAAARESLLIAAQDRTYAGPARQALEDIDRRLAWKYHPEWIGE